jgi:hypothetical protein
MRGTPKGKGHSKIFEDARQEARDREAQKAINTPKVAPKAINTPKVAPKAKGHSKIHEEALQEARDQSQARDHDANRDDERRVAYTRYHTENDELYASNHTYAELHAGL